VHALAVHGKGTQFTPDRDILAGDGFPAGIIEPCHLTSAGLGMGRLDGESAPEDGHPWRF
jgi:hypothetical protein